jgi:hypothetical protein
VTGAFWVLIFCPETFLEDVFRGNVWIARPIYTKCTYNVVDISVLLRDIQLT